MAEKPLKSMDKTQLLNIMREQEIQIANLTAELQKAADENTGQNEQIKRLTDENYAQKNHIENLTAQMEELALEKNERKFSFENAGSLAEASVSVSGIMKAAQETADVYLQNIKLLEEEKTAAAQKIEDEAHEKAEALIKEAEEKRDELEADEIKSLENLRKMSKQYMELIEKAHTALHDMAQQYKLTKFPQINEFDEFNEADQEPSQTEE
ncbi:MAG: hypothetical protein FWF92_09210 [Oscillospiraceae bacterium]|nr:hypothetical protein [Oscillospiraceae bacterium]